MECERGKVKRDSGGGILFFLCQPRAPSGLEVMAVWRPWRVAFCLRCICGHVVWCLRVAPSLWNVLIVQWPKMASVAGEKISVGQDSV